MQILAKKKSVTQGGSNLVTMTWPKMLQPLRYHCLSVCLSAPQGHAVPKSFAKGGIELRYFGPLFSQLSVANLWGTRFLSHFGGSCRPGNGNLPKKARFFDIFEHVHTFFFLDGKKKPAFLGASGDFNTLSQSTEPILSRNAKNSTQCPGEKRTYSPPENEPVLGEPKGVRAYMFTKIKKRGG